MNDEAAACKLETALSMVETLFPNANQALAVMDVRLDARVETAAVTSSGRMLVAPAFLDVLTLQQTVFVVAHELYHVLYGVFDRFDSDTPSCRRWLVNVAHDFIINDMLEKKFQEESFDASIGRSFMEEGRPSKSRYIPSGGLFWADYAESYKRIVGQDQPPLEEFTLETLVLELERIRNELPAGNPLNRMKPREAPDRSWGTELGGILDQAMKGEDDGAKAQEDDGANGQEGGENADSAAATDEKQPDFSDILGGQPELLTEREEAELFPEETAVERNNLRERIKTARELVSARDAAGRTLDAGHGSAPGDGDAVVHALDGTWDTPWERALQKWLDDSAPPVRSWAKASRRAGDRADVVLPGRQQEGFILHVVVDTSGSMEEALPGVFGMIQSFGKTSGVHAVRIVQCDADVTADDLVDIDDLADFQVKGFGGSDMSPGLLRFAEDPTVEAALVITDGDIDYPPKDEIPFDVLWCVIDWSGDLSWFTPGYGDVIGIPSASVFTDEDDS